MKGQSVQGIGTDYNYQKRYNSKLKKEYIEIAKQLCYSSEAIAKLEETTNELQAERILHDARNGLI